jgi:cardiolipin synthase
MLFFASVPTYVHTLNLIAIVLVIFFQNKEPTTRFAWIVLLIFLPLAGFFLYMLFGHNYSRRERLRYSDKLLEELNSYFREQVERTERMDFANKRFVQLARMNMVNDQARLSQNNKVEIFTRGEDKFTRLMQDIREAREYIHLLYFIFRTDELGRAIIELLTEKARQGVEVKVVFDDLGSVRTSRSAWRELRRAGGKVHHYSPLLNIFATNYRNHTKLAVMDGRIGYIGGMNIGQEYIRGRKKLTPWRDTHLRVEGTAAGSMNTIFLLDYAYASGKADHVDDLNRFFKPAESFDGNTSMQILTSSPRPGKYHIHNAYAKMIAAAERHLFIHTPYLIPDRTIMETLVNAAASGVDVRIMLPGIPDKAFVYYASLYYARKLFKQGVKIYFYNGFLHSKMVLVDGQVLSIGSANMDIRSLYLSYEANVCIYDRKLAEEQREQFEKDIQNCRLVREDYFNSLPLPVRMLMPVSQLFSPLL